MRSWSTMWKGVLLLAVAVLLFFGGGAALDQLAHGFHGDAFATMFAVMVAFCVRVVAIFIAILGVIVCIKAI